MKTKAEIKQAIEDTKRQMKKTPRFKKRCEGAIDAFEWVIK